MKINREDLLEALKKAKVFVERGSNLPILATTFFNSTNQWIEATDLETTAYIPLKMTGCKKKVKGKDVFEAFCVNPFELFSIVKLETDKLLEIKAQVAEGNDILGPTHQITIGKNFKTLFVLPSDEFPFADPVEKTSKLIELSKAEINQVNNINIKREGSFKLDSVFFNADNKEIVKTDGHRIHILKVDMKGKENMVISADTITKVSKILGKDEKAVFSLSENKKIMSITLTNNVEITSRLIEMKYPDYSAVIPGKYDYSLVVDREALHKAMKQACILGNERYMGSIFTFNGGLTIQAINPDKGEFGKENLDLEGGKVEPELTIGYNPMYIVNALENMHGEKVSIGLTDATKPIVFTEGDFTGLVMAMRI